MTRFNDINHCFCYHSAPCKNVLVVRFSLLTHTSGILRGSSRVTTGNVRETIFRAYFWFRGRLGHYSWYHRFRVTKYVCKDENNEHPGKYRGTGEKKIWNRLSKCRSSKRVYVIFHQYNNKNVFSYLLIYIMRNT